MALDFIKFIKGLVIRNEVDMTKQLQLQVSASATTGTKTTIQVAQTSDVVITMPDETTTLLGTSFVSNKADTNLGNLIAPTAINISELIFAGSSSLNSVKTIDQTGINSKIMRVISGSVVGAFNSGVCILASGTSTLGSSGGVNVGSSTGAVVSGNVSIATGNGIGANTTTGNVSITTGTPTGAGVRGTITLDSLYSRLKSQTPLRFYDAADTKFVGFKAPTTVASDNTYTLPDDDGSAGQVLTTNGSAALSWSTAGVASVSVRAWLSANQTGVNPNTSSVKINIDSTSAIGNGYDPDGLWAASRFTTVDAGRYHISATYQVPKASNTLDDLYIPFIFKNGSPAAGGSNSYAKTPGDAIGGVASTTLDLDPGDYIEMYLFGAGNNSASTLTVQSNADGSATFISIDRVG